MDVTDVASVRAGFAAIEAKLDTVGERQVAPTAGF